MTVAKRPDDTSNAARSASRSRSLRDRQLRVFMRNKTAVAGVVLVLLVVLVSIAAPLIATHAPGRQNLMNRFGDISAENIMGTDHYGRDIFSRTVWGARVSILVGVFSVSFAMLIGTFLGIFASFSGGWVDNVITRCVDILMSFPTLVLGLMVIAVLGPGMTNVILAISLSLLPRFIRVARGSTLSLKQKEFVEAARAMGRSELGIMLRHIWPNITGPIIVVATLWMSIAVIMEATLSFLGLGVSPPTPTWGNMIRDGTRYVFDTPWLVVFPGAALTLTILAFNLIGDGLRDVLDPHSQS